jgi:hypothetical protein
MVISAFHDRDVHEFVSLESRGGAPFVRDCRTIAKTTNPGRVDEVAGCQVAAPRGQLTTR